MGIIVIVDTLLLVVFLVYTMALIERINELKELTDVQYGEINRLLKKNGKSK